MFQEQGPAADQRRATALPLIAADPTRIPDHIMSGPELSIDDSVRSRFLARRSRESRIVLSKAKRSIAAPVTLARTRPH